MSDVHGSRATIMGPGEIENAYALQITVDREDWLDTINARNKVEVRVNARGQTKDFTFDEFFQRLGFE